MPAIIGNLKVVHYILNRMPLNLRVVCIASPRELNFLPTLARGQLKKPSAILDRFLIAGEQNHKRGRK
jgi:hypothetical protein